MEGTAQVPGCIHTDLIKENRIQNPYYRDNEAELFWIGEVNWSFSKVFTADATTLLHDTCELVCEGLDTLATLRLNGEVIGHSDNMYRRWIFDVKPQLCEGENTLEIEFAAATPWLRKRKEFNKVSLQKVGAYEALPRAILRKEPCNFGWDWGPVLTTCGIWLPIYLQAYSEIRLENVLIEQTHGKETVSLKITPEFSDSVPADNVLTRITLHRNGDMVAESTVNGTHQLDVPNAELWWPTGMGEAALYELQVEHLSEEGDTIERLQRRIGLRTVRLVTQDDAAGQSFYFEINGMPIFSKGANWIPADTFPNNVSTAKIRQLLEDARAVNMNMIRVWGGGYYEPDCFYDLCDELGLLVWQDFMYCCSTYPTDDEAFMANVAIETREQILRLRHHASLCLWCGNNELEMYHTGEAWDAMHMPWSEYDLLFNELLPNLVKELNPSCAYWPGSPHSPQEDRLDYNNPDCGDAHIWDVWFHDKESDYHLDCTHRYISEFGFSSYAHPTTIEAFTEPEDRIIGSYVLGQHQRNRKGDGVILNHIFKRFKLPTEFDKIVWLSQITQGDILREAIEHWRRLQPHTMGALYWQLNDCWPVTSWSTLDYEGRWKASHYMTRRYFAPVLVSVKKLSSENAFEVWLSQDLERSLSGQLKVKAWHVDGKLLNQTEQKIEASNALSRPIARFENRKFLDFASKHTQLVEVHFISDSGEESLALHHFAPLKHINLEDPQIHTQFGIDPATQTVEISLTCQRPAPFAFIDLPDRELRSSDNFLHLFPDRPVTIRTSLRQIQLDLKTSSLYELSKSPTYKTS
mgnify:CR=1 FL=1